MNNVPQVPSTIVDSRDGITFFLGISTASRGPVLIGNQDESTFSIVQSFKWRPDGNSKPSKYHLGFREMLDLRQRFSLIAACECDRLSLQFTLEHQEYLTAQDDFHGMKITEHHVKSRRHLSSSQERIFKAERATFQANDAESGLLKYFWFFYVTRNEAARWLQISDILNINAQELARSTSYVLVDRRCSLKCAFSRCTALILEKADALGLVLL